MMIRQFTWALLLATVMSVQSNGQTLVFDRGVQTSSGRTVSWIKDDKAFVADDFRIGNSGEVWMIDRIRTWVVLDPANSPADLYSNLTLFGGLVDPANSNKPRPAEDC